MSLSPRLARGRLAGLAAALVLAGAGTAHAGSVELPVQIGGAFAVPTRSLQEARFSTTMRQQFDFSCGSAALSTLLTYHYGVAVSEQTAFEEMFRQGDQAKIRQQGFSLLDMKRYLEHHGFEANGFEAPLDALRQAGIPAIVLINDNGYNHFVVVKGLQEGRILIGDPSGGTRSMAQSDFETIWVNRILFVISNRQEAARFNAPEDWRVAPVASLGDGVQRDGLGGIVLPRLGPSDF
ncbi:C39 family peptidase [Azohydromonas caseinilytica]|uniref:C39 family peptidase n=1 Tax=Azohydromonas caseinilytica TaxID=2728836 RepID=A0A848FEX5_9BURK|nr:C39 family peptidase [Azohydromonas caseinilytica]NML17636.1 C39 family peptidase [Azohydromonas caseinilytica]